MTDYEIISILQDVTNKRHKYSDAQYIFAVNYAITKIRSYNDLSRMYKVLAMSYADTVEQAKHEIPIPDNY